MLAYISLRFLQKKLISLPSGPLKFVSLYAHGALFQIGINLTKGLLVSTMTFFNSMITKRSVSVSIPFSFLSLCLLGHS